MRNQQVKEVKLEKNRRIYFLHIGPFRPHTVRDLKKSVSHTRDERKGDLAGTKGITMIIGQKKREMNINRSRNNR